MADVTMPQALYGAGIGLDIGLIEYRALGGTCLNVG